MNENTKIRVMIVDDHAVVRSGLGAFLSVVPDLELVGEAESGDLAVVRCGHLHPDAGEGKPRRLDRRQGVGARTALAVLSGMSVTELSEAVISQDTARLTKVPGIGKKTAERLLLELKDKLGAESVAGIVVQRPAPAASDVLRALVALGYSEKEALGAVKQLPDSISVADGIRQTLKALSKA